MSTIFGSKAPSQFALDAVKAAREAPKMALTSRRTARRSAPDAIRLDAGIAPQWPVRDQFGRGTCVAFATLAAVEMHHARCKDMHPERLSEHFLHARMMSAHALSEGEAGGIPEGGVLLHQALRALEQDGVVDSALAPYKPAAPGQETEAGPAPSMAALAAGLNNRITCHAYGTIGTPEGLDPARVDSFAPGTDTAQKMLDFLRGGLPVAVGLPLFRHASGLNNWILPATIRSGVVHCPEDADAPPLDGPRADGHVVCLTGYLPDAAEPQGGWFIFRNSWGLGFGTHAALPATGPRAGRRGYGVLSATHINSYCWEYLVPVPQAPAT